ncbi:MAG: hypothetical protein H0X66_02010 [Verrucomicrobia bacterium]|nr:hypothetical protein [Verrucomicrobiota bacterium]
MRTIPSVLLLCMLFLGCKHTQSLPIVAEYGTAGADNIQVTIRGDVKHPGKYWIPNGTTLAGIAKVFGGSGGRGDFGGVGPLSVILTREIAGKTIKTKYSLRHQEQLEAIQLKDGDTLHYPAVLF